VFSYQSNGTWNYTYDGANRLTQADGFNASGAATTWNYTYDGGGNRIEIKEVTGPTTVSDLTTIYNAQGQAASATNTTGESITYTHDEVGNLTTIDSEPNDSNDVAYAYDAYSRMKCARLSSLTCPAGGLSVEFAFDASIAPTPASTTARRPTTGTRGSRS
jgi:YD repeat-containing protein